VADAPGRTAASLNSMDIPDSGEDFFSSRVLIHEGVPSSAIVLLDSPINDTADEILAVSQELALRLPPS
jgi:hypothetical protein